ncbi:MAG: putative NAD/FAD-binding protein [Arenicella sp.]|jgi:predicted NAD/FAD-binding protein
MKKLKRLAIIGSGISGLTTAFELYEHYDITLFEKEDYFGGHTDTHELLVDDETAKVDSGFIIFCPDYYPNFSNMLSRLELGFEETDMSFSVLNHNNGLVYNATSLNKMFCQRRNLFRLRFYRMLFDIVRFYSRASKVLDADDEQTSVGEYLNKHNYGKGFAEDHLLPMVSALWSASPEHVLQFPIRHLAEFFQSHGLFKIINRPKWYVIKNGSSAYVNALRKLLPINWSSSNEVISVKRDTMVEVTTKDLQLHYFDAVVFANHADQVLSILDDASDIEKSVLGAIPFQKNHVLVHTDVAVMHPNPRSWASWNAEVPKSNNHHTQNACTVNYWMNSLQNLTLKTNVFASLNSSHKIDPRKVLVERFYQHPVFTAQSVAAQNKKTLLDGQRSSYFVGAYWGWGFHEDGARSAVEVSKLIREQIK